MQIFQAFGLDIKLLIAQLINFLILVFILYKFGYKPILNFTKNRQDKIEKGLKDAETASQRLTDAINEKAEIITKARQESQDIISRACEHAKNQSQAIIKKTQDESKTIVERAKKEIRQEREQALARTRDEITQLAINIAEKLLRDKLNTKEDAIFVKKTTKEL